MVQNAINPPPTTLGQIRSRNGWRGSERIPFAPAACPTSASAQSIGAGQQQPQPDDFLAQSGRACKMDRVYSERACSCDISFDIVDVVGSLGSIAKRANQQFENAR